MISIDPLRWLKHRRPSTVAPLHDDVPSDIARDIAATGRWEVLDDLPVSDRNAVIVRLTTQIDDPLPLFYFGCCGGGQQLPPIICLYLRVALEW